MEVAHEASPGANPVKARPGQQQQQVPDGESHLVGGLASHETSARLRLTAGASSIEKLRRRRRFQRAAPSALRLAVQPDIGVSYAGGAASHWEHQHHDPARLKHNDLNVVLFPAANGYAHGHAYGHQGDQGMPPHLQDEPSHLSTTSSAEVPWATSGGYSSLPVAFYGAAAHAAAAAAAEGESSPESHPPGPSSSSASQVPVWGIPLYPPDHLYHQYGPPIHSPGHDRYPPPQHPTVHQQHDPQQHQSFPEQSGSLLMHSSSYAEGLQAQGQASRHQYDGEGAQHESSIYSATAGPGQQPYSGGWPLSGRRVRRGGAEWLQHSGPQPVQRSATMPQGVGGLMSTRSSVNMPLATAGGPGQGAKSSCADDKGSGVVAGGHSQQEDSSGLASEGAAQQPSSGSPLQPSSTAIHTDASPAGDAAGPQQVPTRRTWAGADAIQEQLTHQPGTAPASVAQTAVSHAWGTAPPSPARQRSPLGQQMRGQQHPPLQSVQSRPSWQRQLPPRPTPHAPAMSRSSDYAQPLAMASPADLAALQQRMTVPQSSTSPRHQAMLEQRSDVVPGSSSAQPAGSGAVGGDTEAIHHVGADSISNTDCAVQQGTAPAVVTTGTAVPVRAGSLPSHSSDGTVLGGSAGGMLQGAALAHEQRQEVEEDRRRARVTSAGGALESVAPTSPPAPEQQQQQGQQGGGSHTITGTSQLSPDLCLTPSTSTPPNASTPPSTTHSRDVSDITPSTPTITPTPAPASTAGGSSYRAPATGASFGSKRSSGASRPTRTVHVIRTTSHLTSPHTTPWGLQTITSPTAAGDQSGALLEYPSHPQQQQQASPGDAGRAPLSESNSAADGRGPEAYHEGQVVPQPSPSQGRPVLQYSQSSRYHGARHYQYSFSGHGQVGPLAYGPTPGNWPPQSASFAPGGAMMQGMRGSGGIFSAGGHHAHPPAADSHPHHHLRPRPQHPPYPPPPHQQHQQQGGTQDVPQQQAGSTPGATGGTGAPAVQAAAPAGAGGGSNTAPAGTGQQGGAAPGTTPASGGGLTAAPSTAPSAPLERTATDESRERGMQSFWEYVVAEAQPAEKLPTADVVWGQTERDRVYNYLLYVPYQLERLIQFGTLLCLDAFLAVLTIMPVRALFAVTLLMRASLLRQWRRITAQRSASLSAAVITDAASSSSSSSSTAQPQLDKGSDQGGKQKSSVLINGTAGAAGSAGTEPTASSIRGGAAGIFRRMLGSMPRWRGRGKQDQQVSKAGDGEASGAAGKQAFKQAHHSSRQQKQKQRQAIIHGKSASSSAVPTPPALTSPSEITPATDSKTAALQPTEAKVSAGRQASDPALPTGGTTASSVVAPPAAGTAPAPAPSASVGDAAGVGGAQAPLPRLGGSQVYDLLCLLILAACTAILRAIKPGFIYFWLKDITSEFLKMSVLSSAFEIADKILGNFGMDVLEALSGTCTLWVAGRRPTSHLAADLAVALGITCTHAVTLMCQGLVLAVALNSKRNGLLALLIANNFVEIKGAVFKRWDVPRIWGLVCMDIVERLHLLSILTFVLVEDMDSSSSWAPSSTILWETGRILGSEVVIDVLKHSVLGKFNDMRPGIYREYMKDLCDKAVSSQSHSLHKLLGFQHLAPGALLLRSLTTLFWLRLDSWDLRQVSLRMAFVLACWLVLLVIKPLIGYALKRVAYNFSLHHEKRFATKGAARTGARPALAGGGAWREGRVQPAPGIGQAAAAGHAKQE